MSNDTTQFERRSKNPVKTLSTWLGIGAVVVGMGAGFAKSYYVTPLKLEDHDKRLERLERGAEAMSAKLQEQRELLLEIRGDIKVLNRASRKLNPTEN